LQNIHTNIYTFDIFSIQERREREHKDQEEKEKEKEREQECENIVYE
jgi:hypothetical protein